MSLNRNPYISELIEPALINVQNEKVWRANLVTQPF